jgi:predicted transposase YbfD/YdcC
LCLLAVLAGAETVVDIARFGQKKIELLRRFLPLRDRTPSHDQLGDILATLDATEFQRRFVAWGARLIGVSTDVIAIDGKTSRRSAHKRGGKAAIHVVSAGAARQRLVLGQVRVTDKSNEIVAIPALLDMFGGWGCYHHYWCHGCQRDIARKVIDKKADYILALKGNQGTLREDVELFAAEQKANGFEDTKITQHQTVDADHGRIETRTYTVIHDVAWLRERHQWPGLQRRHGPEPARTPRASGRQHNRARDAFLYHLVDLDRCPDRAGYPSSLDDRERPSLGLGYDFPRWW